MKRKVIFVNASLTDGGSERVMATLANSLADMGHEVTMILVRNKKRTYEVNDSVKCIQITYARNNLLYNMVRRICEIRSIVKSINDSTIISFMTDINILTLLACFRLHRRVIISERAHPLRGTNKQSKKPFYARILIKLLYPLADAVVFQTEYAKKCYSKKVQKKGYIIPNPLSSNLPEIYNGKRKKVIVAAGRLNKQKNFPLLIYAFSKVVKKHKDYQLIIYGQGSLLEELKDLSRKLGIQESIEFPGYVEELTEQIKDAAMYVSSSDFEGISNSMLEAMAMGIPVVCTDCPVGGAALVIKNNVNGKLVPVGDSYALRTAMYKIIEDKQFAQELSREAVKVREQYKVSKICKMWLDII